MGFQAPGLEKINTAYNHHFFVNRGPLRVLLYTLPLGASQEALYRLFNVNSSHYVLSMLLSLLLAPLAFLKNKIYLWGLGGLVTTLANSDFTG